MNFNDITSPENGSQIFFSSLWYSIFIVILIRQNHMKLSKFYHSFPTEMAIFIWFNPELKIWVVGLQQGIERAETKWLFLLPPWQEVLRSLFDMTVNFRILIPSLTCLFPTGWCQPNREMVEVSEASAIAGSGGLHDDGVSNNCLFFSGPAMGTVRALWFSNWKGVTKTPTFCGLAPSQALLRGSSAGCQEPRVLFSDHPYGGGVGLGEKSRKVKWHAGCWREPHHWDCETELAFFFF